jgi:hypothetical protein
MFETTFLGATSGTQGVRGMTLEVIDGGACGSGMSPASFLMSSAARSIRDGPPGLLQVKSSQAPGNCSGFSFIVVKVVPVVKAVEERAVKVSPLYPVLVVETAQGGADGCVLVVGELNAIDGLSEVPGAGGTGGKKLQETFRKAHSTTSQPRV